MRCGGQLGLNAGARLPQVNRVGSHVSGLENPVFSERPLDRQVPLLRVRSLEITRHRQHKQKLRGDQPGTARSAGIVRKLPGVPTRKILQRSQARHEIGIEHPRLWQSVHAGEEKVGQAPRRAPSKGNRQIRRLER